MKSASRGTALLEFALAWPVALLLVLVAVQLALWGVESFGARSAALAGARAGTTSGADATTAADVAAHALRPSLFGTGVVESCRPESPAGGIRVCAIDLGHAVEVDVEGSVPALVPLPGIRALPIRARVVLQKELFNQ